MITLITATLTIMKVIVIMIHLDRRSEKGGAADLRSAKILDVRGFDSGRISILRGGVLMSIGNFPEVLSQQILVGS